MGDWADIKLLEFRSNVSFLFTVFVQAVLCKVLHCKTSLCGWAQDGGLRFVYSSVWNVKNRNLFFFWVTKTQRVLKDRRSGKAPSSTKTWLSFVFGSRLFWLFSFKVCCFVLLIFFSPPLPWSQFFYAVSCLCVAEAAQAFVLNIVHNRRRDTAFVSKKPLLIP